MLIGYEDLAALEETVEILIDPETMAGIREGRDEADRGEVVRGVDAIRALRPRS